MIFALFAGINDFLTGRDEILAGELDVFLCEFAILVQQLPKAQPDLLSGVGSYGKFRLTCDVLSEVQHGLAGGSNNKLCFQPLMLRYGYIIRCRGCDRMD